MQRIQVIDSHTGGEPTRVVVAGAPNLGDGTMAERRERFRAEFDAFRSAVVSEPRGSEAMVGALLCTPANPKNAAGVIFFNNVGFINMCGHGTMGLVVTLAHLGRIGAGTHRLETPVGEVTIEYSGGHDVAVENVPSYRHAVKIGVPVDGHGKVTGDVAWGGNWFFLVSDHGLRMDMDNLEELTAFTWKVRRALKREGVTGANGGEIDHIELFGPPSQPHADARNFVLCPGGAYDRSPCGTGTSAKLACLLADGEIKEGQVWRQESIIGSVFECTVRRAGDAIIPRLKGAAYLSGEATLLLDPNDPFRWGIRR
jgi:4-hydroxyproline epimerase